MNRSRRRTRPTGPFLLGLFVMVSTDLVWGQSIAWTRRLDGLFGEASVAVDTNGSSYVAGSITIAGIGRGVDIFVRKYESNGTRLWTNVFGGPSDERPGALAVDADGNVYVAGSTGDTVASTDALLIKYDANGNLLWTRQFGSPDRDGAGSVAVDNNGNIYVAGTTYGAFPGQTPAQTGGLFQDAFVRKYNASGAELWTRQFGRPGDDLAFGIAVDAIGSVYVTGRIDGTLPGQSSAGGTDAFVRKYDTNGAELWTRQFGSPFGDEATGIAVHASGSIYVAGSTAGALPGQSSAGGTDAFVRKYDANGAELWTRQFGNQNGNTVLDADFARAVVVDADGNVSVAGYTLGTLPGQSSAGGNDAFVRKYDANGAELWTRQFGHRERSTSFHDFVWDAAVYTNDSVYLARSQTTGTFGLFALTKLRLAASLPGDANGDGRVDCQDIAVVRAAIGTSFGFEHQTADQRPDVDFDDQVDVRDLAFVSRRLAAGTRCP